MTEAVSVQGGVAPRQSAGGYRHIELVPFDAALGAEVRGVTIPELTDDVFREVRRAWLEHLVLVFRDCPLSDPQLIAYGDRFGELDPPGTSIIGKHYIDEHPEILVISNIVENGVPKGNLGAGEAIWHTDISYRDLPPSASVLHAIEIPPRGGNTYWANQYLAWETLSAHLRRAVQDRAINHDESTNSADQRRKGFPDVADPREAPGARHPIVRTHPETGRKCLYLGRRRNAWIVGLPLDESEALLDEVWAHATQPDFVWGHEWRVGDTLVWDNRCTLHRRDSFEPTARRMMHRVQVKGDRPY